MTLEFEFPDTGEGVTEGKFLKWLIEEGEEIEEDETVAEVETDKAVVDIPAPADGTVEKLKAEPGDDIEVGEVIMEMETGEKKQEESKAKPEDGTGSEIDEEEKKRVEEELGPEFVEEDNTTEEPEYRKSSSVTENILALPKVRKMAEEKNVDLSSIKTGERITEEEVLEAAGQNNDRVEENRKDSEEAEKTGKSGSKDESSSPDVKATPAVRKLAREKEVNITSIEGSGRGGKITRDDILEAAETDTETAQDSGTCEKTDRKTTETAETEEDEERVELSNIRKSIGEKMEESKFTAPHVTHTDKATIEDLVEMREEMKDGFDVHLTYMPFIMKAVSSALEEHPRLNAELDRENDELILKKHYDFNVAVDTEQGLMVPLVEDVDDKSIVELGEDVNRKAKKARDGNLSPNEMENGTFSITNIGVIGGESFTPIINYPQAAILGVGKIQETAEVVEGEVEPLHTVKLSLSYDHRIVDGADAARFMNTLIEKLENPEKMLMEI